MSQDVIKKGLQKFINQSKVFDMLPISSEILALDSKLSIYDLIEIFVENVNRCCLVLDTDEQTIIDIILPLDLNTILIQFKLKQKEILLDSEKVDKFLNQLTIQYFLQNYKYYKKMPKSLVWISMKTNLKKIIEVFKSEQIGHIVVKNPKHPEKEYFAILTKQDFLLYILKSYRANIEEKNFLELKISDINLNFIKTPESIKTIKESQTLFQALELIEQYNISFIPIISEENKYKGFLKKSMFFWVFYKKLYHFLDRPIIEFYEHLLQDNMILSSYMENLFFTPENNLFDVFRKFIYTQGQVIWIVDNELRGLISLHDMFDYFLQLNLILSVCNSNFSNLELLKNKLKMIFLQIKLF